MAAIYAPMDYTTTTEEKMSSRWVKNVPDTGASVAHIMNWAYQPAGTNKKNPLLSPRWAKRDELPPWLYIVSCELDMLGIEEPRHWLEGA